MSENMEESEPTPIVIDVQVQDSATNQDIKREDDPNVVNKSVNYLQLLES